jgi:hypothetical protein
LDWTYGSFLLVQVVVVDLRGAQQAGHVFPVLGHDQLDGVLKSETSTVTICYMYACMYVFYVCMEYNK